jgi:ABC-type sugar transport system substrate-binding protein
VTLSKAGLARSALIAAVAAGAFAASSASADVVCNRWGECWRVHEHLAYPPGLGITYHNDAWWAAHQHGRWHWRADNFAHGYYRNGVWIAF